MRNAHKLFVLLTLTMFPLFSSDIITNLRNGCKITAYFDPKELTVSFDPTIAPYWEEIIIENDKRITKEIPGKPLRYMIVWTKWQYIPGKFNTNKFPNGKTIQTSEYYMEFIFDILQNRVTTRRGLFIEQTAQGANLYDHMYYPLEFETINSNKKQSRRSPIQALREEAIDMYAYNLKITKKDLLEAIKKQENGNKETLSYFDSNVEITSFDIIHESSLSCSATAKITNKSKRDIAGVKVGIQDIDRNGVILGSHGDFVPVLPAGGVAKLSFNCDKQTVKIKVFNVTYK